MSQFFTSRINKDKGLCDTCIHRRNSIKNVKEWRERGSVGLPCDPVPKAECKEHSGYTEFDGNVNSCRSYIGYNVPTKKVQKIKDLNNLPEPFKSYWFSKERLDRDWDFYLVEGELYIDEKQEGEHLFVHWTKTNCCGVLWFISQIKFEGASFPTFISEEGQYLFSIERIGFEVYAVSPFSGIGYLIADG